MKKDKKISIPMMAVKNLQAKKFRTGFMIFFVILMSATVFFSTILINNLKLGIKNTTERMGADMIVVPKKGTENVRESLFAGTPCTVFFNPKFCSMAADAQFTSYIRAGHSLLFEQKNFGSLCCQHRSHAGLGEFFQNYFVIWF